MSHIHFDGIELRDGRKVLYRDLSFDLHSGQIGAVFGPSRTGKSSILLLAAGHLMPMQGRVTVGGRPPDRKQVGVGPIHDLTPLFDTLTVEEHVLFQARLHGVRQPKVRTAELLQDYDLMRVKKRRVKDIGNLEQFRVGLATALVHRPRLILIDEPEKGLTNDEWDIAYLDLRLLVDEGHTVLLTTVLQQVAESCDLIVELPTGEVIQR